MAGKMPDALLGERHGTRAAISAVRFAVFPSGTRRATVTVRCDCGVEGAVDVSAWRRGKANECTACRGARMLAARTNLHGYSGRSEYQSWLAMRRRCLDERFSKFPAYGGAGITVYAPWAHSFQEFIRDVGPKPSLRHTLDRIDTYGGYYPYNVRWATPKEQRNNQRPRDEAWEHWENATTGY